jgi:hypothetical protein
MGVRQWGAETDTPDREEFNASFAAINARAAYDDGATYTAFPVTDVVQGRWAKIQAAASPYYTMYRRSDASSWEAMGGNTDASTRYFRNADGSARAWEAADTDLAGPSAWVTYGGDAVLSGRLVLLDQNPGGTSRGALHVGSAAAYAPTTLGRMYVRTVDSGDRGVVLDAHADLAGALLAARRNGGQDLFSIDSQARMQTRAPSSFGAADLADAVAFTGAPGAAGALTTALLLHGQSADPTRSLLVAQRFQPGGSDTGAILQVQPNRVQVGRSGTWTGGAQVVIGAPAVQVYGATTFYAAESDADPNNLDVARRLAFASTGFVVTTGVSVDNRGNPDVTPVHGVYMFERTGGGWSGYLAEWLSSKNESADGSVTTHVSYARLRWDGRLETNAPWKGSGTRPVHLRDTRQSLVHVSRRPYVDPGDGVDEGVALAPNASYVETWAVMTPRSLGAFDLLIEVSLEVLVVWPGGSSTADAQPIAVTCAVKRGGGTFDVVGTMETAITTPGTDHRPGGDLPTFKFRATDLTAAQTFQIRTTVTCGGAAAQLRLRGQDVEAAECLLHVYA